MASVWVNVSERISHDKSCVFVQIRYTTDETGVVKHCIFYGYPTVYVLGICTQQSTNNHSLKPSVVLGNEDFHQLT